MYSREKMFPEEPDKMEALSRLCSPLCRAFEVAYSYEVKTFKTETGRECRQEYVHLDDETIEVTATAIEIIRLEVTEWILRHAPLFPETLAARRMQDYLNAAFQKQTMEED